MIEQAFNREGSLYLACNEKRAFFTSEQLKDLNRGHVRKFVTLSVIFIRVDSKLYRHIVGIPMGTSCAPVADLFFLICYERDFMLFLFDNK